MAVYQQLKNGDLRQLTTNTKVLALELPGKDGKSFTTTEFERVKVFGVDYLAVKSKDGTPRLYKANTVKTVSGYMTKVPGKDGKPSYMRFIPEKECRIIRD